MKRRICGRSMFLGAVIMLIGLAVGTIVSPPLGAQRNGVFDEILCKRLTVVDEDGNKAIILGSIEGLNVVIVLDKQGEKAITLESFESGNSVVVLNKQGKEAVELTDTEYGGRVSVYNNQGKNRVAMGVNEYGNGAVSTWDKNGYRQ